MARKHARSTHQQRDRSSASVGLPPPTPKSVVSHAAPTAATGDQGRREVWIAAAGLLLLAGLHLGGRVEPALRYQQSAPPFFTDAAFFARFTGAPGGLLHYLAAGLAQLNFHNWLGTVAFTALLGCLLLCARCVFASVAEKGATVAACGLVALVATLPGRYEGEVELTALGILVALAAASLWSALPAKLRLAGERATPWPATSSVKRTGSGQTVLAAHPEAGSWPPFTSSRRMWQRPGRWIGLQLVVCWGLAAGVFYVAGALPTGLFVVLVVLNSLWTRRSWWLVTGCALALLIVPFWVACRPGFHPFPAAREWGHGMTRALHAAAFLFVPIWLGIHAWLGRARAVADDDARKWRLAWALGLCAMIGVLWASLDAPRQALAQLERALARQEWDRALTAARLLRQRARLGRDWPVATRIQLARALYHAGRLPEDLFSFPQRPGQDLLPDFEAGLEAARAEAPTLMELGQVNLAEHMAHESLELDGSRPDTLLLLAHINILKDRPEAARVFLNRLRLAPFHRAEAERELQFLAADPAGTNRPDLSAIRARMPRTDEPDAHLPTEALLRQLLRTNPTNRMAFDYLLAHRLQNSQLEDLAADLGRLDTFGDPTLARPCEEAMLLHRDRAPAQPVDLHGRQIRSDSIDRYRRFTDSIQRYRNQPEAARAALAPEFGNTFWYYSLFGETAPASAPHVPGPPP